VNSSGAIDSACLIYGFAKNFTGIFITDSCSGGSVLITVAALVAGFELPQLKTKMQKYNNSK
jgi:hypothetical protein